MVTIVLGYFVVVNVIALAMYGIDKQKAKNHQYRIPEKTLIGVAVIGGSIGAWVGMQLFRHKTRHPKFVIGIPVIVFVQVLLFTAVDFFMGGI